MDHSDLAVVLGLVKVAEEHPRGRLRHLALRFGPGIKVGYIINL